MNRDTDALKEALEHHSVQGYPVVVPTLNEAVITEQGATGPVRHITPEAVRLGSPMVFFKVKAKKPVPFHVWVEKRFRFKGRAGPTVQLTLDDWIREYGGRQGMPPIPDYLMKKLEEGGSLSWVDVEHDSLVQRGCIDPDDNVYCYTFWSSEVLIDPRQLQKGQLVEYEYTLQDKDEKQFLQGRIVGFMDHGKVALLEVFTPIPYLETPDSIASELIKKGFHSEGTYAIGYGTYEAMEIAQEESGEKLIPEGKWDSENRIFTLKDFLPLSVIQDICAAAYGEEPHCLWQALIMYIVPIKLSETEYKGTWRPLPERAIESEYVISYDFEE